MVKFIILYIASALSIGLINHNSIAWITIIAFITALLNLLIGDLLVLYTLGNGMASIIDGLLAGLSAHTLDRLFHGLRVNAWGMAALVLLTIIGEYFYHLYLIHSKKLLQ